MVRLKQTLGLADAVVIGAGAGLSTSAGFVYSGERFELYFGDFKAKYGFQDMYSGGSIPIPLWRNIGPIGVGISGSTATKCPETSVR